MKSQLKGVTDSVPRWATLLGGMKVQTAIKPHGVFTLCWEENKTVLFGHSYQRKTHIFHFNVFSFCEG